MSTSKSGKPSSTLADLSSQLAAAVETAGNSIVAIHARRRIPSSGIVWRDGVVVSASHTVKMDEKIPVTLPGGESTVGTVIGRDSATDLVALRIEGAKAHVAAKTDTEALKVGSLVLAVGRPGRDVAASFGIISAIGKGWRTWQGARINVRDGSLCRRRLHHQGLQHVFRLTALVRVGPGHDDPQRPGSRVTGSRQRRAALAPIHGAGARLLPPFFAGFLEPSSKTSSQLIPCRAS